MSSHVESAKSIPSLPDDLLVSCLARVSRWYYPTLSLVSKRFCSLLASPELYKARSLLGNTESCLYVCLPFPTDLNPTWLTLCRKPDKTLKDNLSKKSSGNLLVPISSPDFLVQSSNIIAVGSKIYGVGREGWSSSSGVSVLDCQSHTWHKAPSMRGKGSCCPKATLVDGKMYVARTNSWKVEVFDPKTQTWGSVMNPVTRKYHGVNLKSFGLEGKFYLLGIDRDYYCHGAVYNPKEGKWNNVVLNSVGSVLANKGNYCVIDNILMYYYDSVFSWYDFKLCLWKKVNGVEGLPCIRVSWFWKLVDYGGKLLVLWDESSYPYDSEKENIIWCAVISLERRIKEYGDELWGEVEWFDVVLTIPGSYTLKNGGAISVIV